MALFLRRSKIANPQKENGYIPIANEIAEAMARHDFSFSKGRVFWAILRKTYGWNKKEDKISISQICELTKLSKRQVIYTLQNLEAQNKIIVKRSAENHEKQTNEISIQKDYSLWNDDSFALPYAKLKKQAQISSAKLRSSAKLCKSVVQNSVNNLPSFAHTKDTITKDSIQKTNTLLRAQKHFYETYKQKTGQIYIADFGKDGAIFKNLLPVVPEQELIVLIDRFFETTDDYIIKAGFTVGVFKTQVNKLKVQARPLSPGQKTYLACQEALKKKETENVK